MNLIELVKYLRQPKKIEELYKTENLDPETQDWAIYMVQEISLYSQIYFFSDEDTNGKISVERNGEKFVCFFFIDNAIEAMDFLGLLDDNLQDFQIAERLLEYQISDG